MRIDQLVPNLASLAGISGSSRDILSGGFSKKWENRRFLLTQRETSLRILKSSTMRLLLSKSDKDHSKGFILALAYLIIRKMPSLKKMKLKKKPKLSLTGRASQFFSRKKTIVMNNKGKSPDKPKPHQNQNSGKKNNQTPEQRPASDRKIEILFTGLSRRRIEMSSVMPVLSTKNTTNNLDHPPKIICLQTLEASSADNLNNNKDKDNSEISLIVKSEISDFKESIKFGNRQSRGNGGSWKGVGTNSPTGKLVGLGEQNDGAPAKNNHSKKIKAFTLSDWTVRRKGKVPSVVLKNHDPSQRRKMVFNVIREGAEATEVYPIRLISPPIQIFTRKDTTSLSRTKRHDTCSELKNRYRYDFRVRQSLHMKDILRPGLLTKCPLTLGPRRRSHIEELK